MIKKTAAQIRRLQKRAEARGEEYTPPPLQDEEEDKDVTTTSNKNENENPDNKEENDMDEGKKKILLEVAMSLKQELETIETSGNDGTLKSKDRRTAKRKAEAIAAEKAGMPVEELLAWYEKQHHQQQRKKSSSSKEEKVDPEITKRATVAAQLQKEIAEIEASQELKAKDRRSAKRKAEAIATESSGMPAEDLMKWYETFRQKNNKNKNKNPKNKDDDDKKHDPYIAFVGQLSYETTKEQLFEHIKTSLATDDIKVNQKNCQIRVLSDPKTKKSRGMAFVEVDSPDLLYALLKLHQTFLNGRRINIERSAGGKKNSAARKAKLEQCRKEQDEYFGEVVENILNEYRKTGELREDELDEGVIKLAKRHSGPIVQAAVAKYIEGSGRDMDNPSAYLTFLLTKFSQEGIFEESNANGEKKPPHSGKPKRKKGPNDNNRENNNKKHKGNSNMGPGSEFAKSGVDMSISAKKSGDISKIFPSARRGRGYMM